MVHFPVSGVEVNPLIPLLAAFAEIEANGLSARALGPALRRARLDPLALVLAALAVALLVRAVLS